MTHTTIPEQHSFEDDGKFPNSRLPVLIYRHPLESTDEDLAGRFESRLAQNQWTNSWRNGVYDYAHYHSTSHEVLAVYRGEAVLQLGGPQKGANLTVQAGDVAVIPAGVSHQQVQCSNDFGVVGAYPDGRHWDVLRGKPGERPAADRRIAGLPTPDCDPLFGKEGPLITIWH